MADYHEKEINGVTVKIDRTLCIGSGNCTNLAPEVFEIDETSVVDFTDDADEADIERDRLEEACNICPVDALIIENEDGEQVVP